MGMVKESAGKSRQGMACHAREDDEAEDEVIDHSFHGKIGFSRVSPKAYLAAFEANLGVGSREPKVEEEATSGVCKIDQTTRKRSHEEFIRS